VQVTGHTDPQAAAEAILSRPNTATEWCVVKMGGEGAVLVTKSGEVHHAPAFKVRTTDRRKVGSVAPDLLVNGWRGYAGLKCRVLQQMGRQMGRQEFCSCVGLHGGCACSTSLLYVVADRWPFCVAAARLMCRTQWGVATALQQPSPWASAAHMMCVQPCC
jgi:hypothetical protein